MNLKPCPSGRALFLNGPRRAFIFCAARLSVARFACNEANFQYVVLKQGNNLKFKYKDEKVQFYGCSSLSESGH